MSNIIDIHINRSAVGTTLPFDKIYLVHKDNRDLIPKIFGYALVLPFSEQLIAPLSMLKPAHITHKKFRRDDESKEVATPVSFKSSIEERRNWWSDFFEKHNASERVVVVPILVSTIRKVKRPRYLTSPKWRDGKARQRRSSRVNPLPILSEFAYLATPHPAPDDKIRPICTICPRALLNAQGQCAPGEPICYSTLNFAEITGPADASVQSDND